MTSCVFCEILSERAEASIIYKDDLCTAFLTIEPVTEGHALVVPNEHHVNIFDIPDHLAGHMFKVAKAVARAYGQTDIRCEGVNLVMCNGAAASQTVFHAHIHVNPRYKGDGFSWNLPPRFYSPPDREQLDSVASKLATALSAT